MFLQRYSSKNECDSITGVQTLFTLRPHSSTLAITPLQLPYIYIYIYIYIGHSKRSTITEYFIVAIH